MDHKLAFVVSLVGLGISSFLAYAYLWAGEVACPVGGAGCDVVRLSEYRSVLGIPVTLMGIGFSLTLAVLEITRWELLGALRMIGPHHACDGGCRHGLQRLPDGT